MSTTLERSPRPLAAAPFIDKTNFSATAENAPAKPKRLISLDVFRGITIAAMLLVNNINDEVAYKPLTHADWHGWTPTDLIFPFFLFIVGVAIPFALARRGVVQQLSTGQQLARIWSRALALVVLGVLLGSSNLLWPFAGAPDGFTWSAGMRMFGFCFVYASIFLLLTPWPWRSVSNLLPVIIGVLLLGYLVTMHYVRIHAINNGWPASTFGSSGAFNPDMLRIPGVLQRIGICYGFAATIALFAEWRGVLLFALLACAIYSVLMLHARFPNKDAATIGSLTKEDNFARYVDEFTFNHRKFDTDGITPIVNADGTPVYTQRHAYRPYPDNEGIVSTLPAIATSLIGVLVGFWLRSAKPTGEHAAGLFAMGIVVALLGLYLDRALMPINKNLWTPSFTVFTAGMAMLVLGFVYWLIEVCGRRAWAWPFKVMGMNAIAAFVLATLIVRASALISIPNADTGKSMSVLGYVNGHIVNGVKQASTQWQSLNSHFVAFDTPANLTLACGLAIVLFSFLVMWLLYVCRIFVKV